MTRDVLVTVKGLQFGEEHEDSLEVVCNGVYYNRNGKHYIMYDEIMEGAGLVSNKLKVSMADGGPRVEVTKKLGVETTLLFEKGKRHLSCYETDYGSFSLGFYANHINVEERKDELNIHIDYALEMNFEHLSDNQIEINVVSKM